MDRLSGVDPIGDNVVLDEGIMDVLPPGCRVLSTSYSGESLFVETMKIEVEHPDGSKQAFFKKGASGEAGLAMMKGCYESEKALRSFIPEFVPRPVAYGTYKSRPDVHFFISDFVELKEDHPDPKAWATTISTLHQRSVGKSPDGKFGFHVPTYLANIPLNNTWNSSWERFWSSQLRSLCEIEEERRGADEEFTRLKEGIFHLAIPRYLRPLESDGRSVQPCLIHGDAWPGNIKPIIDSPETLALYDSAAIWGHNELDVRPTRPRLWGLEEAGEKYREIMGVSEPQDDHFARIDLYEVLGLVLRSAMFYKDPERRLLAMEAMQSLVDRVMLAPTLRSLDEMDFNAMTTQKRVANIEGGTLDDAEQHPEESAPRDGLAIVNARLNEI